MSSPLSSHSSSRSRSSSPSVSVRNNPSITTGIAGKSSSFGMRGKREQENSMISQTRARLNSDSESSQEEKDSKPQKRAYRRNKPENNYQLIDQATKEMANDISNIINKNEDVKIQLHIEYSSLDKMCTFIREFCPCGPIEHNNGKVGYQFFEKLIELEGHCLKRLDTSTVDISSKVPSEVHSIPLGIQEASNSKVKKMFLIVQELKDAYLRGLNCKLKSNPSEGTSISKTRKIFAVVKKVIFVVLALAGVAMAGALSYIAFMQILPLIFTSMSSVWVMPIAICLTFLECLLFCGFDGKLLAQLMGLNGVSAMEKMNTLTIQQRLGTIEIKNSLLEIKYRILTSVYPKHEVHIKEKHIQEIDALFSKLNLMMSQLGEVYKKDRAQKVSLKERIFRAFVTLAAAFGIGITIYFGALMGLTALFPGLVGTPLGWALVAICIFVFLAFFLAMRGGAFLSWKRPEEDVYLKLHRQFYLERSKVELRRSTIDNVTSAVLGENSPVDSRRDIIA